MISKWGLVAVSVQRIVGPMPFSKTLNSKRYVRLIMLPFFNVLTEGEELYWHFMQDGAMAHKVGTNNKVYTLYCEEIIRYFCSVCK
jgi:hypothetical protein